MPPVDEPTLYSLSQASPDSPKKILPSVYVIPIRETFVWQTEHVPRVAGLPFLSVTCHGFRISRSNLHFRQYASIDTLQGLGCAQFTTSQGDSEIGRDEADRISVAAKRKWLVQKHSGGGSGFAKRALSESPTRYRNLALASGRGHESHSNETSPQVSPGIIQVQYLPHLHSKIRR